MTYIYCEFGVIVFPIGWEKQEGSYFEAHKKMEGVLSLMKSAEPDGDISGFTAKFLERFQTQLGLVEKLIKARIDRVRRRRRVWYWMKASASRKSSTRSCASASKQTNNYYE